MILINSVKKFIFIHASFGIKNLSCNKCTPSHDKQFEGFAYFNNCKQKIINFETIVEIKGTVYRHGIQWTYPFNFFDWCKVHFKWCKLKGRGSLIQKLRVINKWRQGQNWSKTGWRHLWMLPKIDNHYAYSEFFLNFFCTH